MKRRLKNRHIVLGVLLLLVWMTQLIPALATVYSRTDWRTGYADFRQGAD